MDIGRRESREKSTAESRPDMGGLRSRCQITRHTGVELAAKEGKDVVGTEAGKHCRT